MQRGRLTGDHVDELLDAVPAGRRRDVEFGAVHPHRCNAPEMRPSEDRGLSR